MRTKRRLIRVGKFQIRTNQREQRRLIAIESLEPRLLLAAQAYTWQNAAIGAGGFVDGIFYSPTQQNVIYARADIGGLYKSVNDGQSWQELLDFVGDHTTTSGNGTQSQEIGVLSFAIDPKNPNNLYALVGQYQGTNGDVLYSTDGGQTWGQDGLSIYVGGNSNGRATGERIAVDPNDSSIIFLGSNANGLWKSTNSGHSFSQITSFPSGAASNGITFVLFNPSGTSGHASQTIYVGSSSTDAGTNLYVTTNGGSAWTEITGTGAAPTGWMPNRAALASDGNLYLAYSNDLAPSGNLTNGGVLRYNTSSGVWTSISPDIPGVTVGANDTFGYVGIALDPESSTTLVVTSFDRYNHTDQIWRTIDANAATPTWTGLYDNSSAQNGGYGGFDATRNTSNAPWVAAFGDGIGNWAGSIAIDPFNSNQLMYGTGQGIWATNSASNGGTNTQLTAADSWYFPDNGIEFTAVQQLAAPPSGVPLFSAIGDINGFAHTTLTSSPAGGGIAAAIAGGATGSMNGVDFAGQNPNIEAIVGQQGYSGGPVSSNGAYTTDDGSTWTEFASAPGGAASGGSVAVSADGSTLLWASKGNLPYYSPDDGTTWTASTLPGGTATGGKIVSDKVNPNYFYYWTENSNDNSWTLYVSSDGGRTFTASVAGPLGIGNVTLVANPFVAGDLWLSTYIGIYHSTDFGASFTQNSALAFENVPAIALGAPAPGSSTPAIYIYGTINNFLGVYRSDDGGNTWVQLNDVSHQWGGVVPAMAADPNVFGRVYLGINGRGVIVGNPTSSLPAGWTDADINTPGNPGWAISSTTLSKGATVNQWTLDGGGAGIQGTSDQFNFAYEPVSGSAVISAQITGMTNADPSSALPEAGIMIRAGTNANDPFAAMVQTPYDVVFEYRTTTGGNESSALFGVTPGYVKIIRNGDNFSGYYSSDGTTWTQLGSTIAIAAMPTIANVGLAASAAYNPQLTQASFADISVTGFPTVDTAAAANPSPVPGSSTALSVLGSEFGGGGALTYLWSSTGPAGVTYTGAANGTNAANNITAVFTKAGSYNFTVTITDPNGFSVNSSVAVTVNALPASQLAIVEQPAIAAANIPFVAPVEVAVEDARGSAVSTDSSDVTIHLANAPAGGALTGTVTVAAVNGIAVFSDLSLATPGAYTLDATDSGLTGATTVIQVIPVTVPRFLFSAIPLSEPALIFAERRMLLRNPSADASLALQFASPSIGAITSVEPSGPSAFAAASPPSDALTEQLDATSPRLTNTDEAVLSKS
ncbi:MAG: hypothetical protein ABSB74_12120 [Tepidisphaeraceae bacterium]